MRLNLTLEAYYTELCTHLYEMPHIFSYPPSLLFVCFSGPNEENYAYYKENANTEHTYS